MKTISPSLASAHRLRVRVWCVALVLMLAFSSGSWMIYWQPRSVLPLWALPASPITYVSSSAMLALVTLGVTVLLAVAAAVRPRGLLVVSTAVSAVVAMAAISDVRETISHARSRLWDVEVLLDLSGGADVTLGLLAALAAGLTLMMLTAPPPQPADGPRVRRVVWPAILSVVVLVSSSGRSWVAYRWVGYGGIAGAERLTLWELPYARLSGAVTTASGLTLALLVATAVLTVLTAAQPTPKVATATTVAALTSTAAGLWLVVICDGLHAGPTSLLRSESVQTLNGYAVGLAVLVVAALAARLESVARCLSRVGGAGRDRPESRSAASRPPERAAGAP